MGTEIPIGKMARTQVASQAALKIGTQKLKLFSKKPFLTAEKYSLAQQKQVDETAKIFFEALTRLRGTALKVAQLLSLEMEMMPESYRQELQKSHYRVPPLNRAMVRKRLLSEFGEVPEVLFDRFEGEAFAAASLGQVHRATSHDKRELAVKVQYPGIERTIHNDLQMVQRFFLPFFQSDYLDNAFKEIEARLIEETDYQIEFRHTEWFKKNMTLKKVVIPEPIAQYSTSVVLTTEHIPGVHLDEWLKTHPSQQEKNEAAQTLWNIFVHSFFELQVIHSDPNPGNFLFMADRQIGLIDFGSVKKFDLQLTQRFSQMIRAFVRGDEKTIKETYCLLGIPADQIEALYPTRLRHFGDWVRIPFLVSKFDFKANPDYCEHGMRVVRDTLKNRNIEGFTSENVMFDRNVFGLFRVFTQMGAQVDLRNQWMVD